MPYLNPKELQPQSPSGFQNKHCIYHSSLSHELHPLLLNLNALIILDYALKSAPLEYTFL